MQHTGGPHRSAEITPGGRLAITALLLVLPVACLVLALTSPPGSETAWLVIAAANLVLPAVMLALVWRGSRRGRAAASAPELDELAAREPSLF